MISGMGYFSFIPKETGEGQGKLKITYVCPGVDPSTFNRTHILKFENSDQSTALEFRSYTNLIEM